VLLASAALVGVGSSPASTLSANTITQFDLLNPAAGQPGSLFGRDVTVLPNGNVVVTDPSYDAGAVADVGAVYLYNGRTRSLISTLTGTSLNDSVGSGSVVVLSNGNYVVPSPFWDSGSVADAGAVTWGNGKSGTTGVVDVANSLVGTTANDTIGSDGVAVLSNGNYVVRSPFWDSGLVADVGAVTWGNGATGTAGVVGVANSLVGTTSRDYASIYDGVVALSNGNYVVRSSFWDSGSVANAGAVTWGNGTTGTTGVVGVANSLVGATPNDSVGARGIVALSNGNYVVRSPYWGNGVGAVTWGNGATGTMGVVGVANSLVGTAADDIVGSDGVVVLSNGNYVVRSSLWGNGSVADAGAVTWGNGTTGTTGVVSAANSLVGTNPNDKVGFYYVVALSNGHYVVTNPDWDNGSVANVGAVTWGNGATGTAGVVGAANSLVGTTSNDTVGGYGAVALSNGNYVVRSPSWDNGSVADAGAATWGNGATGTSGVVGVGNSLVGTTSEDSVSGFDVVVLSNGNYVVPSPFWDNGSVADVGAVTWGNGTTGAAGAVGLANSLVGAHEGDGPGTSGITALSNGNYVVSNPFWDSDSVPELGAVTWANGATGITGVVGVVNSLVGSKSDDKVGSEGVVALSNGNYVVTTTHWHNGAVADAGAVTWGNGAIGTTGAVNAVNSLVGTTSGDFVGRGDPGQVVVANSDGSYVVLSDYWDSGAVLDAGAATYGPATGVTGVISIANSAIGTLPGKLGSVASGRTAGGAYAISTLQDRVLLLLPVGPVEFAPLSPGRLADTRPSGVTVDSSFAAGGARAAGSTFELTVAGRGGVPAAAQAVSLNVTAVDASADGFATVFPCGSPKPNASNLNYRIGRTLANAVITKLGAGGKVCIYVSSATQLVVDVNGSFPATSLLASANPARVLDTRPSGDTVDNLQTAGGLRAAGSITTLPIAGRANVPANAKAVIVNVTATGPTADGFLTVYPCGTPVPNASNLNFKMDASIANLVVSKLGAGGELCIETSAATHLVVDVTGYFPAGSGYEPLQPARLLDTRASGATIDSLYAAAGLRPSGTITELTVTGRGGVSANAETVVLNITATGPTADGFISVYPCGIAPPNASNLNFATGSDVANTVIVKPGMAGKVCISNSGQTHLIADVNGFLPN
jgi:Repeat of unknown function (DUF5650)